MKRIQLVIIFILIFGTPLFSQMYFNLDIEEGSFITAGNIYFINNISSDIAYIYPLSRALSLIGYYQLKYSGPGIGDSAETKFSERSQDHYFMIKTLYKLNNEIAIKPVISFFKEFYKFGKNEDWGEGLYDYNKYELGSDFVFTHFGFPLTLGGKYQIYKYPNYSNLLVLFQTEFTVNEPEEDYKNIYGTLSINEFKLMESMILFFEYNINYSTYDNKKILQATGYAGSENQKITYHSFSLLPQYKLNSFIFGLNLLLELNDSNQNYISGYSVDDIEWKKNYYSFTSFNIKPSVSYVFKKDQYLALVFSYFDKKYKSREAQDTNGGFSNSKLSIQSMSIGFIYSVKLSKYFSLSPSYMYAQSTSNNKYQRAVSYNYNAHLITLNLNYEY